MKPFGRRAMMLALVAGLLAGAPPSASAQRAPADTAAVLYDVALELEREGRLELSRALLDLILERYPGSTVAQQVRERLVATGPRAEESGRVELMVWSTLYGLWLGAGVPAAFDADGPEAYGLGLLVGGPAGFFASKAFTDEHFVSEGHARTLTFGGTWGTWQGLGWQLALDLGIETERICVEGDGFCYEQTEPGGQEMLTAMIVGGLAGIGAGELVARRYDVSAGSATLVNLGALWGTYYALSVAGIADVEGDDAMLIWALTGGNAGLLATALLAPRWDMSRGRARLISISGIAGLVGGLGLDLLFQPDEKVAIAIPMISSAAGLALGAHWTRDYDRGGASGPPGRDGEALLRIRGRDLALGAPGIAPTWIAAAPDGARRLGLRLQLLQARF